MATRADILLVAPRAIDADTARFAIARCAPQTRIVWLKSADEALQYLFSAGDFVASGLTLPAVVFIEEAMPVAGGLCLAEILKAHPRTRHIPLVLLQAERNSMRSQAHLDPDHRVVRPCDLYQYRRAIGDVLAKSAPWLVQAHSRKVVALMRRERGKTQASSKSAQRKRAFGNI
jgi:CheY-like chemotaxis protein